MPNESIREKVTGRAIPLPGNDIDTDQIIPARYLKCITFEELGRYAFYDERFDGSGKPKDHPLNDPRFKGGTVMVVGRNFGCGSSREHAPQSLMRMGFRAFVGESFAEIFFGNCTALGLPCVRLSHEDAERLTGIVQERPGTEVTVDLSGLTVSAGGESFPCDIPDGARQNLITGTWDTTAALLEAKDEIRKTATKIPYMIGY